MALTRPYILSAAAATAGAERRRHPRYASRSDTCCSLFDDRTGEHCYPRVRDLSVTGVSLAIDRRIDPGRTVAVRLYRPGSDVVCEVTIRVVYAIQQMDGSFVLGAAFTDELNDAQVRSLSDTLAGPC